MKVTPAELEELRALAEYARHAPVMTVRSDLPTFSQSAWKAAHDRANELAAAYGKPGCGIHLETGEIVE